VTQPRTTALVFFILPVRMWVLVPAFLAGSAYAALYTSGRAAGQKISHADHFAGGLVGVAFGLAAVFGP
jgi:Leu/Phe-tRNA-protein transferase